jgi:hypothetical protein
LSILRRLPLGPVLTHAGVALLAAGTVLVLSPRLPIGNALESVAVGGYVRLALIDSAWRMFLDHPVTGVGVFAFPLLYPAYRLPTEQATAGLFVHNDYVQLLAEGGVFLLVLPVLLAFGGLASVVRGVASTVVSGRFERLGAGLAVTAACAHAMVNFVFYSLPLAIVLGVLAAGLSRPVGEEAAALAPAPRWLRALLLGLLAYGAIAWSYLILDLAIVGVFQGQPGVPFAASIRREAAAQLQFARLAQALNPSRGIPVFAEAALLAKRIDGGQEPQHVIDYTVAKFRAAIDRDPWNTFAYVAMADFVARRPDLGSFTPEERPEQLLLKAVALDPVFAPAIDRLLALYAEQGRFDAALVLLHQVVLPWIELLQRRDDDYAARFLDQLERLAAVAGRMDIVAEVERRRRALAGVKPVEPASWFD